jgi:hypothetical protein
MSALTLITIKQASRHAATRLDIEIRHRPID